MKYILFLLLSVFPFISKGQKLVIAAREAIRFEGKWVTVRDSVYEGKVINDSTAIYYLGGKASSKKLAVIHITRPPVILSHQSDKYIKALQLGKVIFKGEIFKFNGVPTIVVRAEKDMAIDVPTH